MSDVETQKNDLIALEQFFEQPQWGMTSVGSASIRLSETSLMISQSEHLNAGHQNKDYITVDVNGKPFDNAHKPPPETLIHALIYGHFKEVQRVIHMHSVYGTVFGRAVWGGDISFRNYDLQKRFSAFDSHENEVKVKVLENHTDMVALSKAVNEHLSGIPQCPGFIIAGRGVYTWGATQAEAIRHCETMEFLLECEYKSCLLLK